MARKPTLLAVGDAPQFTTGFATVNRNVLKLFHEMGFDIHLMALNWDGHCPKHEDFPYRLYNPAPKPLTSTSGQAPDLYGHMFFPALLETINPDLVFILNDISSLAIRYRRAPALKRRKVISMAAFETEICPRWWFGGAQLADRMIVFSEWQKQVLLNNYVDLERIAVIPHGYEEQTYYPLWNTLEERANLRKGLGVPEETFLLFRCDRNEFRKQWPILFEAFGRFLAAYPDALAHVYAHTSFDDHFGWNLDDMLDVYARDYPEGRIILTEGYESPWGGTNLANMNLLYNVADAYITTTGGEAWGLTMHESQACGVPVIAPRNTACTEVVQSGWLINQTNRISVVQSIEYNPPTPGATAQMIADVYNMCQAEGRPAWWEARMKGLDWAAEMTWENVLRPLPDLVDGLMAEEKVIRVDEEDEGTTVRILHD